MCYKDITLLSEPFQSARPLLAMLAKDAQIQPGAHPGNSWVLWELLLELPGLLLAARPRWACQGTGCPNPTRRFSWPLLGALGLLLELPGLLLAALSHVGQDAQIQPGAFPGHSWVLLGCSWNFPGPVMPCALCASMQRSCYPRAPNWDMNVRGVWGKPQGFSKNPKP